MDTPGSLRRVQPLLAGYAVPRTGDAQIPGHYDPGLSVWVVDTADGLRPIIETGAAVGDTSTTTRVQAEKDDTDVSSWSMANTSTFTKVNAEGDDTDVSARPLAEIATKTQAQVEGDDHTFTINLTHPQAWGDGPPLSRRLQ
ncbi:MAG: hypothetical protein ABI655_07150 [Phenylobacterium sp.]